MAFQSKKERQQIIILIVVLCLIAIGLLYVYKDSILPKPVVTDGAGLATPERMEVPTELQEDIFTRKDFAALEEFGDVPVKPLQRGSTKLFDEIH